MPPLAANDQGGLASLGGVAFRINPQDIAWNYRINSVVKDTVGGRVVQVLGATLTNITIQGEYGEDHSRGASSGEGPGRSWRLAEAFIKTMRDLMERQSLDSRKSGSRMQEPLRFLYPAKGWDFSVYLLSVADPDGGSIQHRTGKFSYSYALTLFIVADNQGDLQSLASGEVGVLAQNRQRAVEDYIARVSEGVGWKRTDFNDPFLNNPVAFNGAYDNARQRIGTAFGGGA